MNGFFNSSMNGVFAPPNTPRLDLAIAPDGSARLDGAIPFPSGHGFILLAAEPGTARCACADADGDGHAGLIRVEFLARDPRSGELVPVTLAPAEELQDIDRPGRYEFEVRVGDQPGMVTVLVIPAQRRRKRRRQRRRKPRRRR
jgi:hypothetical protein